MKKWSLAVITISLCLALSACALQPFLTSSGMSQSGAEEQQLSEDDKLIRDIVGYFMPLTEIPRQSQNEEQISEYLYNWAKDRGYHPVRDSQNNVLFDVPGTEGMENAPLTILQAHMDMVVVAEEGKSFDPNRDPIPVINDGITLTADGTSLGADDGMGIATALYIVENNESHGPLRIIFTTNEEAGMTGALNLTADDVDEAKYLINLDYEVSGQVTNSSASGTMGEFYMSPEAVRPGGNKQAYLVSVSGMRGGHSGVDINKGRINAILALGAVLSEIQLREIHYDLASVTGGSVYNAIPASAAACVMVDIEEEETLVSCISDIAGLVSKIVKDIEPDASLDIEKCDNPGMVLSEQSKEDVLRFLSQVPNGVYALSDPEKGFVRTSSSLGLVCVTAEEGTEAAFTTLIRSSDWNELNELVEEQKALAEECALEVEFTKPSKPWSANPDSALLKMVTEAYREVTGDEMEVVQVHGGLETGKFALLNDELDMVSIGYDISNPHSVNESCDLRTIPDCYRTLERVLTRIGEQTAG